MSNPDGAPFVRHTDGSVTACDPGRSISGHPTPEEWERRLDAAVLEMMRPDDEFGHGLGEIDGGGD